MDAATSLRRIVVAGNGIAGLTACDTLRAEGFDGEILVVGAEHVAAYSRPALSKALLRLDGGIEAHELPEPTHGATELRGVSATALDPHRRRLRLSDGDEVAYDGLVIATGSGARRLTSSPHELTLRELSDALALRDALAGAARVVVVGGGVLGMEIASGALAAGCRVTLLATAPPMSKALGPHLAGVIADAARTAGLDVMIGDAVAVDEREDGVTVRLDDVDVDADLVITAVGDRPRTQWLETSGLLRDGALVADSRGRVGAGIVAAGDVATWSDEWGRWRLPLWTSAIEQARTAATALLRGEGASPLRLQPYFWTEQFGIGLKAVGPLPVSGPPEVVSTDPQSGGALLRWPGGAHTSATAVAVNYRIPIPRLRRLTVPEVDTVG